MDVQTKKVFIPSEKQADFFKFVRDDKAGSALLIAVAGSGKSTSIVRSLPYVKPGAKVQILAFNNKTAGDVREKVNEIRKETGNSFHNVFVSTFHSAGFGALGRTLKARGITMGSPDGNKCRTIFKKMATEEQFILYSSFVTTLVSIAKGQGIGVLCKSEAHVWHDIVDYYDLELENNNATIAEAITWARKLMAASYKAAKEEGSIDFDDMLFMPLALDSFFYPQDLIYVDEAQDTNPVRREIVKRMLKRGGRVIAVGDPKQAIYGFTGATNEAMEIIKDEFNCQTLYLNVSYRCPKAVVKNVQKLVPYFEVHEGNIEGDEFEVNFKDALDILTDNDAILCRNVAPLVSLAFKIIATGRACHVLGSEIGRGLAKLVERMQAPDLKVLRAALLEYAERESQVARDAGKEQKAQNILDKVECLFVMIDSLPESSQSIPGLLERINSLFSDEERTLCLSSCHKSKGREWTNVVIYRQDLMPSPWARQEWQYAQELNLEYVARTRTTNYLLWMEEVK